MTQEQRRDTTIGIWEDVFLCNVPYRFLIETENVKNRGIPHLLGNNLESRGGILDSVVQYNLTIDRMTEFHRMGICFGIIKQTDLPLIYQNIQDHLNAWLEIAKYSLNIRTIPTDDLLALDNLAADIYTAAANAGCMEVTRNPIKNAFARKGTFSRVVSVYGDCSIGGGVKHTLADGIPERISYSDAFITRELQM